MPNPGILASIALTATPFMPKSRFPRNSRFFTITISWIFWIFDAKVASTGPDTHLKRRGSKFCVGWWSGHLHSSHMDPIGEKTVPHMVNSGRCVGPKPVTQDPSQDPRAQARPWTQAGTQGPSRALGPLGGCGCPLGPFALPTSPRGALYK